MAHPSLPPALLSQLRELALGLDAGESTSPILSGLIDDLLSAIPSYAGLQITLIHTGHPVVLTVFTNLDHTPVTASLRLPLAPTAPGVFEPGSVAVFWAHTPGAFIDMAADFSNALQPANRVPSHSASSDSDLDPESEDESVWVTLDVDLPPRPLTSGMTGLSELSSINQAIGVLIARGYEPDDAKRKLRRDAETTNQPVATIAADLVS